jgi:hypothetical protein
MTVLTETARPGEAIMSEGMRSISRENLTIAASQTILANALLAKLGVASGVTVAQSFAGIGNGVLTMANPNSNTRIKDGNYTVVFIEPTTNLGTFEVVDPNGDLVGTGVVGTAFNKEIKFTIADGSTDFVAGDTFTLAVTTEDVDFQWVNFDPTATDGSEVPAAYSIYACTTGAGETKKTAGLVRMCELNGNCIAWPSGITDAQRVDAIQALASNNIIVRY